MRKYIVSALSLGSFFFSYGVASAHEAYVLPYDDFWAGIRAPITPHVLDALKDTSNLWVGGLVALGVFALVVADILFRRSTRGQRFYAALEGYSHYGQHFIRIAIAVAFFFAATSDTFLGPELHGALFPHPYVVQLTLFAISFMIAVGLFTELAAVAGIALYIWSFFVYGPYVFTYLNYLGELIVLVLFGMRVASFDRYIFGRLKRFTAWEKYKTVVVRIAYGFSLLWAAVTIKLLHPDILVTVVNTWHLTQFHWLFPSDPLLITLGAGIVESLIGICIIFGLEMRLVVLVSLFYITLSLFYFQELVWPHLLLYGISFNLLVQPEYFSVDRWLFRKRS